MAWGLPTLPSDGDVATVANWATKVINCLRYLKGLDGDITLEDDVLTSNNVDGVDVSAHEARHVSGGADDIDSALAIAAMPNLTNGKVWKGDVSNRPAEIDFPTRTLSDANDTVQEGYYAATTLSTVDADLAVGNIKKNVNIFGKVGTLPYTLVEDTKGGDKTPLVSDGTANQGLRTQSVTAGNDVDLASKTLTFDANSMAVAVGFTHAAPAAANRLKLRMYMGGTQAAESAYLSTSNTETWHYVIGTRALSGSQICQLSVHCYTADTSISLYGGFNASGYAITGTFIGVGSIKLV